MVTSSVGWVSQPRQGFAKVRAKTKLGSHISCSQECKRVRERTLTLPSEFPFWELKSIESPNGLSNFQRAIVEVKTHWIKEFFILLKSFWNVDV